MGILVDRTRRELTDVEISRIASTYHAWCGETDAGEYWDISGFCKSATLDESGDTLLARITPCLENGKTAQVKTAQVNVLSDGAIGEGSTEFISKF